jgi:hypothetical protein
VNFVVLFSVVDSAGAAGFDFCRLFFPARNFRLGLILVHSARLDPSRVLRLSLIAFCDFCWKSAAVSVLSARASRLISFFAASLVAFRDFCWKRAA